MIKKPEYAEALGIIERMMSKLITFPISSNIDGAMMRSAIGKFIAEFPSYILNQVFGTELLNCFELARTAGATLNSMNRVYQSLSAETPVHNLGNVVVNAGIIFSFTEQCQIITVSTFGSRNEVDDLMDTISLVIEDVKLNKADSFAAVDYQGFISTAALLIEHLSSTERQLPRVVDYTMAINYPALALSNRIYGDGSRSDELIAENQTVHPAFMQREIVALSE
jgi:prophage DNA circulation protein